MKAAIRRKLLETAGVHRARARELQARKALQITDQGYPEDAGVSRLTADFFTEAAKTKRSVAEMLPEYIGAARFHAETEANVSKPKGYSEQLWRQIGSGVAMDRTENKMIDAAAAIAAITGERLPDEMLHYAGVGRK